MDRLTELADRRAELKRLIADLEVELDAVIESRGSGSDDEHDPEGSTIGYERARLGALLDGTRATLQTIELALDEPDADVGRCESCGEPIGAERLAALVVVKRCAACARAQDTARGIGQRTMR